MRTSTRRIGLIGGGAAVAVTTLYVVSLHMISPDQVAAAAEPAAQAPVTEPVERRRLEEILVARGDVTLHATVDVWAVADDEGRGVVTRTPLGAGAPLAEGDVLLEVDGRPLLALRSESPWYRDLRLGDTGLDVLRLQEALARLGRPVEPDGVLGQATRAAMETVLVDRGYPATLLVPAEAATSTRAAEARRESARLAVTSAEALRRSLETPPPGGDHAGNAAATDGPSAAASNAAARTEADLAVATARAALVEAEDGVTAAARESFVIPSAMLVASPTLPAIVSATNARVGRALDDQAPAVVIGSPDLVVEAGLTTAQSAVVSPETTAALHDEATGQTFEGVVETLRDTPDGESVRVAVVRPSTPIPADLFGRNVRVEIEYAASDGTVLAVPLTAVTTSPRGEAVVAVVDGNGPPRRVVIQPGVSAGGWVEVASTGGGRLDVGDRVVVG